MQENEHAAHPDWERRSDFCNRVCKTLADLIDKALAEGQERLVIVAHGGTQMAALERFGVPRRSFHDWCGPNAGGYVLVGVVSFAAASAFTALCFRLRNRENQKKGGADKPNRHEQEEKSQ